MVLRLSRPAVRAVLAAAAAVAAACVLAPRAAPAQAPAPDGWNGPRARALVESARARRTEAVADTGLIDYQADGRGFIYFYLDSEENDEPILVKTDQVALEVLWAQPNRVKQRVAGWRSRNELPARIHYYLDRMTVVQDNFGDAIVIADGENVRDVPHPLGSRGDAAYDFRLADSVTVRLPGAGPSGVRVYEVQVRPKDTDAPGVVGSFFLDPQGALVRMAFTFTKSAYVERRLDYINVVVENALFRGRYWLPYQQSLEIRREIPELDWPVGTVIRTRMRLSNYRFNQGLPPESFRGPRVVFAPKEQREAFAFDEPIDAQVREEGIGPTPDLEAIRTRARQLIRERALSGLPTSRLGGVGVSEILRYDRAQGVAVGAGLTLAPLDVPLRVRGGWAFGPGHPFARAEAQLPGPLTVAGWVNQAQDVGVRPAGSALVNTISSLLAGEDFTDPYYASGAEVGIRMPVRGFAGALRLRAERQRSADRTQDESPTGQVFRSVQDVDDGWLYGGELTLRRSSSGGADRVWRYGLTVDGGTLDRDDGQVWTFVRPRLDASWERGWTAYDARLEARGSAGIAFGDVPRQALWLLGGRGTLPGYTFRRFGGDRYAVADVVVSGDAGLAPWVRPRLLGAVGVAGLGDPARRSLDAWGFSRPIDGVRGSVGVGAGLLWDVIRVDVHRGLGPGGRWELVIDARPAFWGFL